MQGDRTLEPVEWPTALLAAVIYAGWFALTFFHSSIPLWLLLPLGAWFVAWHSSLQHEIVHGHFTRWSWLNRLIAYPPLALWLPYDRYRDTHLLHHRNELLTEPVVDPESRYWRAEDLRALGPIGHAVVWAQTTMLGNIVIGGVWTPLRFMWREALAVIGGDRAIARAWLGYLPGLVLVVAWVKFVCGMDLWLYTVGFAIPGTSLMLIRSFAEHRAVPDVQRRSVIVEGMGPFAVLYLNNNLHATHHHVPGLAWYKLPAFHRAHRARLATDDVIVYRGYADLFRRFLLRPHDRLLHPLKAQ